MKPEEWDVELDGEWTPDEIVNPDYYGVWTCPRIPNPEYRGVYQPRMIPNPKYVVDNTPARFRPITALGINTWQIHANTSWDDILLTTSLETAEEAAQTFFRRREEEKYLIKTKYEDSDVIGDARKLLADLALNHQVPFIGCTVALILLPFMLYCLICGKAEPIEEGEKEPKPEKPKQD